MSAVIKFIKDESLNGNLIIRELDKQKGHRFWYVCLMTIFYYATLHI